MALPSQVGERLHGSVALAAVRVGKSYTAAPVLTDVSLELRAGEVHAIVGENGAGKSTLIRILSGVIQPNTGELRLNGDPVRFVTPHDALARGVSAVHQEFNYCPALSVTENLYLGQRLPRNRFGWVDWRTAEARARDVLDQLGVDIDVRRSVGGLSPETRKLVEISRALIHRSDVLILDEPTAALPAAESERLFGIIRRLRDRGVAIAYVSHRLTEVLQLADRISVLRDGRLIATQDTTEAQLSGLVRLMVGRPLSMEYPLRPPRPNSEVLLKVRGLSSPEAFRDVSLDVSRGEILGIAGLDGSGRSELAQALAGDRRCDAGEVLLDATRIGPGRSVYEVMDSGVVYVPPDRQHEGLHLGMSIADNISLPVLRTLSHGPFLDRAGQDRLAQEYMSRLDVRASGPHQVCSALSGGNQQKVLLAKWLATRPRVLLLDEPTRGVDVGAKAEIHALIRTLADGGAAILLASSEMLELLGMSDRVLVLRAGLVTGVFDTASTTAEDIGFAAATAPIEELSV